MDGILCLDKGEEITSFLCCSLVRRLLNVKKAGHAGTLDPMATGVLPILVGRATRALDWLPVHDKRYTADVQFGCPIPLPPPLRRRFPPFGGISNRCRPCSPP